MMWRLISSISAALVSVCLCAFPASGADLNGSVATTYYSWEENVGGEASAHNYLIHYLRLNVSGIADNKLSFHGYGSGRQNKGAIKLVNCSTLYS